MKQGLHPKYENTKIKCACGNEIETRSTVSPEIHIELCSACHPFFTGKQKFVDTAGRVDKFRARMEASTSLKKKDKRQNTKKEDQKSNAEKLAEIKKQVVAPEAKPMAVDQEMTSAEEIAAADELADNMSEHKSNNQ